MIPILELVVALGALWLASREFHIAQARTDALVQPRAETPATDASSPAPPDPKIPADTQEVTLTYEQLLSAFQRVQEKHLTSDFLSQGQNWNNQRPEYDSYIRMSGFSRALGYDDGNEIVDQVIDNHDNESGKIIALETRRKKRA